MDEYVSKEAFIKRFEGMNMSWVMTMLDIFKEFPAADVVPARHGRWIYDHWCEFKCSECDNWSNSKPYKGREKFCPNCGAKMDLEE